jgi:hypothetical protein
MRPRMGRFVAKDANCPRALRFWPARALAGAVALVALMLLGAPRAEAFPQWQFSTGNTHCNQCHDSPSGGGLINTYGRDAAGEDLSTFGGDGSFLHGAVPLPSWLALGGDLRGAYAYENVQDPNGPTSAFFPMQADLYLRLSFGHGFSFSGTAGFRDQIRSGNDLVPNQNYQPIDPSQFISREHYVMWQPASIGPYFRLGRFFVPFGLRPVEHIMYIRRDLGLDTLQETYNLSGGFILENSELHITAFMRDYLLHVGGPENGFAAYYERQFREIAALAGQTKFGVGPDAKRLIVGAVGKIYVDKVKTQFFAEGDFVQVIPDAAPNRQQFVGAGGLAILPYKGVLTTLIAERFQDDLAVRQAEWTAFTGLLSWFPYAHVEAQVMLRADLPGGGVAAKTFFAQIHYYL